jgi:hypothetical protein
MGGVPQTHGNISQTADVKGEDGQASDNKDPSDV